MARKSKSKPKHEYPSSYKLQSSSSSSAPTDAQLSATILALTHKRGMTKTICPSEVPRMMCPSTWRACMPRVRAVAIRLAKEGHIDITQKGQVVVAEVEEDIQGPIRLRLRKQEGKEDIELKKSEIKKGGRNGKPALPTETIEHSIARRKRK